MQILARGGYTDAQVSALLTAPDVAFGYGASLLNPDLTVRSDLSADLYGGEVSRSCYADIHGTCKLQVGRPLAWGTDLVQPFMDVQRGPMLVRFLLGVFALATPSQPIGAAVPLFDVTGYDRLYFLRRQIGDTYPVASGTGYLAAVRSAITAAGLSGVQLDGTAEAKTLPADLIISDPTTTWLDLINRLLGAIGYRGLWCNETGAYTSGPYATALQRSVEFPMTSAVNVTLLGKDRSYTQDVWAVPNRWRFIQQNRPPAAPAPSIGDGVYVVDDLSSPLTGQSARGLVVVSTVLLDAADQPSLVTQGDRIVAGDKTSTAYLKLTTGPFPAAGHFDVFSLADSSLPGVSKVQATAWTQPLVRGGDVTWEWRVVA